MAAWGAALAVLVACGPDRRDRPHARLAVEDAARRRPNVLILIGDDHAAGTLGIDGDPRRATPRLDQLARAGVRFDRAYCNAPLCTPSRQSLITGRLPHAVGVTRLTTPTPDDALTLGHWLGDLGYETVALGKMHFNAQDSGADDHHGFRRRLDTADWEAWLAANPPPGGDHHFRWRPFHTPTADWLNATTHPFGLPDDAMESSFYVRAAENFLQSRRASPTTRPARDPFALVVSFYEPHAPFKFPDGWSPRFSAAAFPDRPASPTEQAEVPRVFAGLSAEERRGIAASYFTSLSYLDRQVGRVLDALDAAGLARETIVVYLGDNGYLLGDHGRFEKHCFYEAAVRVPLILRWPGHLPEDRRVAGMAELVDLVPTLLDLLDAPSPPGLHGRSLVPLIQGKGPGRAWVVSEFLENEEAMIRSDRYKLIVAAGGRRRQDGYAPAGKTPPAASTRLFDELADPAEEHDLAGLPEYAPVVASLRRALLDRLRSTREGRSSVPPGLSDADALRWCLTPQD